MSVEKLNCPSCGGPLAFGERDHQVVCGFCNSTVNIQRDEQGMLHSELERIVAGQKYQTWKIELDNTNKKLLELREKRNKTQMDLNSRLSEISSGREVWMISLALIFLCGGIAFGMLNDQFLFFPLGIVLTFLTLVLFPNPAKKKKAALTESFKPVFAALDRQIKETTAIGEKAGKMMSSSKNELGLPTGRMHNLILMPLSGKLSKSAIAMDIHSILPAISLADAMRIINQAPEVLLRQVPMVEAEQAKSRLESLGLNCEIH
ncbi:hypothetical protein ACFLXB_06875 [Chloroflexota bacterium]